MSFLSLIHSKNTKLRHCYSSWYMISPVDIYTVHIWGILSSPVIVFTRIASCLQPHPANIESNWLLAAVCYPSKTKRTLCVPLHWFSSLSFFLLLCAFFFPTSLSTAQSYILVLHFRFYSLNKASWSHHRKLPLPGWDNTLNSPCFM